MKFEYDPEKSRANKAKHGLDFEEAKALWNDPERVIIPSWVDPEPRFMLIGQHDGKMWSAIFTERPGGIRIISVRRSRDEEKKLYG